MMASGTNRSFSHTVRTSASPAAVWRVWTDVGGWPRWDVELESARLDGVFRDGAEGVIKPRSGPPTRFRISQVHEFARYVMRTVLPGGVLSIERRQGPGAFTHEIRFVGPLGAAFAELMGPGFRRALPVAMERVRVLAEQGA
jgi:hypothetical protein